MWQGKPSKTRRDKRLQELTISCALLCPLSPRSSPGEEHVVAPEEVSRALGYSLRTPTLSTSPGLKRRWRCVRRFHVLGNSPRGPSTSSDYQRTGFSYSNGAGDVPYHTTEFAPSHERYKISSSSGRSTRTQEFRGLCRPQFSRHLAGRNMAGPPGACTLAAGGVLPIGAR